MKSVVIKKIDGDKTTVEELCKIMQETGGYFDGDEYAVCKIVEEKDGDENVRIV